jgi:hypothetical protein
LEGILQNGKLAVGPDQIPDGGPRVEKGEIVHWSDWEIGRDPLIWGEDSLEFKVSWIFTCLRLALLVTNLRLPAVALDRRERRAEA